MTRNDVPLTRPRTDNAIVVGKVLADGPYGILAMHRHEATDEVVWCRLAPLSNPNADFHGHVLAAWIYYPHERI